MSTLEGMDTSDCRDRAPLGRNKDYDHIELPAPQDAGYEPIGERIETLLNAYVLDTKDCVPIGFKHELVFTAVTKKREFDVHKKGGKEDALKLYRHKVLKSLLFLVVEKNHTHFFKEEELGKSAKMFGFDNGCALYAPYELAPLSGVLIKEELPAELHVLIHGTTEIKYNLSMVEKISLEGINIAERSALQLLEVLTWMKLDRTRHIQFLNKAYYTTTKCPEERMDGGKVIKNGFAKSIRPIGDHLAIQIDGKVSPFFKSQKLIDFCKEFGGEREIGRNRQLAQQLRGICVFTTHLPVSRIFEVKGFARMSANELTFEMKQEDGSSKNVSVAEYFELKYNLRLRFPELPLVEERKGDKASYHPIEVLCVAEGQRVSNTKTTSAMTQDLIKRAQKKPNELFKLVEEQRYKAYLDGSPHEPLDEYKFRITSQQIKSSADIVFSPTISTRRGPAQPDMKFAEKWKMERNDQFVQPAKPQGDMFCIIFDRCYSEMDAEQAIQNLFRAGIDRGMELDPRKVKMISMSSGEEELRQFMFSKAGKAAAIIGFTQSNTDCVHDNLKLYEAETGIVTLHCTKRVIDQVLQGKPLACGNIMMKFNQKLGGINFSLGPAKMLATHSPKLAALSKSWFSKTRMYMGLFVSHAGAQSFADRSAGVQQSEPTVVGMGFTTSQPTKQEGGYFMQQPGENLIQDMTDYLVTALQNFASVTGALPNDIVVYRNGKSEGEFKALSTEAEQFEKAFERVKPGYSPSLVIIVVCVGSNYRMVMQNNYGLDNVPPGTCLTSQGCNPFFKEFVLVAQRAIMGTARPIRYTVVHEKKGKLGKVDSIDELKLITNALAYCTGIVTAPISLPAPIDSAEKLANRGRKNYNAKVNGDDASSCSSGPPRELRHDGSEDFFKRLSARFESKIKRVHYWA